MYTHLARFTAVTGKREDLVWRLSMAIEGLLGIEGLHDYSIYEGDGDTVWVIEQWTSKFDHDASLNVPGTREFIAETMPLIANVESFPITYRGGVHKDAYDPEDDEPPDDHP